MSTTDLKKLLAALDDMGIDIDALTAGHPVTVYVGPDGTLHQAWYILTAPTAGATEPQLETATRLWDPASGGPLGDLRTALAAARDIDP